MYFDRDHTEYRRSECQDPVYWFSFDTHSNGARSNFSFILLNVMASTIDLLCFTSTSILSAHFVWAIDHYIHYWWLAFFRLVISLEFLYLLKNKGRRGLVREMSPIHASPFQLSHALTDASLIKLKAHSSPYLQCTCILSWHIHFASATRTLVSKDSWTCGQSILRLAL